MLTPAVVQASAARFLIDGGEENAASVLLSCELTFEESGDTWYSGDEVLYALHIKLTGPRAAYEILSDEEAAITIAIRKAVQAVLPSDLYVKHFTAHASLVEIDTDWRNELLEIARGRGVHNQASVSSSPLRTWKNLRFRSQSEIRIAEALDRRGVMFLPNCLARLTLDDTRANREADFLVCSGGFWGILEVDGEEFHPPSRTAADHARDRVFRLHGIRVVEHFDATECYQSADAVVDRFLKLLATSSAV